MKERTTERDQLRKVCDELASAMWFNPGTSPNSRLVAALAAYNELKGK